MYSLTSHGKIIAENIFGSNEGVIAYLAAKDRSLHNNILEMLEKHCNYYIGLEGNYINDYSRFLTTFCCFIVYPMSFCPISYRVIF